MLWRLALKKIVTPVHGRSVCDWLRVLNAKSLNLDFLILRFENYRSDPSRLFFFVYLRVLLPPLRLARTRRYTRVDFRLHRCCWPARAWPSCCSDDRNLNTDPALFPTLSHEFVSGRPGRPTRTAHVRWDRRTRPCCWRYDGRRGVTTTAVRSKDPCAVIDAGVIKRITRARSTIAL